MQIRYENSTDNVPVNKEILEAQWEHILYILRSYVHKNEMSNRAVEINTAFPSIIHMHNVEYITTVLTWCKLFSDKKNHRTSIKYIFDYQNEKEKIRVKRMNERFSELKQMILDRSEITSDEYNNAANSMITTRDKFIAHCDIGNYPKMPYLEVPIKILTSYHSILRSSSFRVLETEDWYPATDIFPDHDLIAKFTAEAQTVFEQIQVWRA
ncbi:MAG TPA: helix-loop-helix domain-containing protein [Nitratidesulfovibrio sp.]|nr:helix-loop-helix domain-containing protein [Nitratidesulfovibrio sp.]